MHINNEDIPYTGQAKNQVRRKGAFMEGVWENIIWVSVMPNREERRRRTRKRVREVSYMTYHPKDKQERADKFILNRLRNFTKSARKEVLLSNG